MKKRICFFIFILLLALCTGCSDEKKHISSTEEGYYNIYSVDGDTLKSVIYETYTKDSDLLTEELLLQMGLFGNDTEGEDDICVKSHSINNQVVYLSFNKAYSSMGIIQEVLFRASVVKTIAQVPGISYVYFYVDGAPLTYSNGSLVGKMAATDFVDETDDDLNSLAWATLKLYFANEDGNSLVASEIPMAYSKTMSMERLVVEQLIAGPDDGALRATLPSSLKVLGISVKNGICYLNFDTVFLNEIVDLPADIQIYSIVNSLCELSNINEVQIQVNGGSHVSLRDISLESTFSRNPDIIDSGEDVVNK